MNCAERDADLQAFLDGELKPSEALVFQQHVETCSSCQSRLQFFQELRSQLRTHTATYKAPKSLREHLGRRLRQAERQRRLSWHGVVAIIATALLVGVGGLYWMATDQRIPPLLTELISAHEAIVRGQVTLTLSSADRETVRLWFSQRLPFRPRIPEADWGGFHILGARTLALSDQEGALLLFGRDDRRVSLVSLSDRPHLPGFSKKVEVDGITFWIFIQGVYTIILWSEEGILSAMVSDDDVEESLEYARLCARQMRLST
jgi:anti-sigma factor (TIGR02949 family)